MKKTLLHAATSLALLGLTACAGGASYAKSDISNVGAPAPEAPVREEVVAGKRESDSDAVKDTEISFASSAAPGVSSEQSLGFAGGAPRAAPPPPPPPPPAAKPIAPLSPGDPTAKATAGEVAAIRAPLLVYTAQISIAVFEVEASLAQVEALGRELGGFLARREDRSITIRIPAARFDEAVKRLEKVGDMLHRNVTAEDVTEEFRDLEVRLKSAHAVQARLTELLAKATKVEESVMIERELDRVTGEIDRIEGRMKFLRDRATFSTITVTFAPKNKESLSQGPFRLPSPWLQQLGLGRLLQL